MSVIVAEDRRISQDCAADFGRGAHIFFCGPAAVEHSIAGTTDRSAFFDFIDGQQSHAMMCNRFHRKSGLPWVGLIA
jgi:hypothetical protein